MTEEEKKKAQAAASGGVVGFAIGYLLRPKPVGAECPPYTLYVEYIEHQGSVGWGGDEPYEIPINVHIENGGEPYDIPINVHIDNRADYAQQAEVWLQAGNDIYTQEVWLQPGMNTVTFTIQVLVPVGEYFDLNMTASIAAASSVLHCGGGG